MGLDWPSECQPATEMGATSPDTTDHTWDPGDVFRVVSGQKQTSAMNAKCPAARLNFSFPPTVQYDQGIQ